MDSTEYQTLVKEATKLLPLSLAEEVNAVVSAAITLMAMQAFDWKAVRAFLEIRENRDRALALIRATIPSAQVGGAPRPH